MYANKTTTLAIVAIVTAIALVAAGSITTSTVAARKHASKSDSLATTRDSGGQSSLVIKQLISCLTSLNGGVTKAAINDCVNNALGMGFGSSPTRETLSGNSDLMPSAATTSTVTGQ